MYAKNYILYKILNHLSESLPQKLIDKWRESLVAVYASKTKFVVFIADCAVRAEITSQYAICLNDAIHECFGSSMEMYLWPFKVELGG